MSKNFIAQLQNKLSEHMVDILSDLLPGGEIRGNEYVCASLAGGMGKSCSTNIMTGVGKDFAAGDSWSSVIALAAKVWSVPIAQAAKRLEHKYSNNRGKNKGVFPSRQNGVNHPIKVPDSKPNFTVIMPIPDSAPSPFVGEKKPTAVWCYHDAQGNPLYFIARYEESSGKKVIRPRVYGRNRFGKEFWAWKSPPSPRPLYNLNALSSDLDKPVLVVEGEKTAEKAQELLPDYVVTTWSGGANAVHNSDWSPLKDRIVTIWPDNDKAGQQAANTVRLILPGAKVVVLPDSLPAKWDLADSVPEGFDLRQALEEAVAVYGPVIRDAATWILEPIPASDPIIEGVFDVGDKCFLIGGSKMRKSFFIMQAALSIAAGKDFLGIHVPKARRVAIAQFEIKEHHYQRRLNQMATAMWTDPGAFPGKLKVLNLRGNSKTLESLCEDFKSFSPELLIVDPLYKLYSNGHDENSAGDMATLLSKVDKLAEELGAAIMIVHHDNKSASGDIRATGRGAGSGLLGRDYDSCFLLTPHAIESDALVLSTITRNYPPVVDLTIRWHEDKFIEDKDIIPKLETSVTRRAKQQRSPANEELINTIHRWFDGSPIGSLELQLRIQEFFGVGQRKAEQVVTEMVASGNYSRQRNPVTKRFEVIQVFNPVTSLSSQNADTAQLRTCPQPTTPAPLYKGGGYGGGEVRRRPGTRRKTVI